jgi:hypothetical protein
MEFNSKDPNKAWVIYEFGNLPSSRLKNWIVNAKQKCVRYIYVCLLAQKLTQKGLGLNELNSMDQLQRDDAMCS